MIHTHKGSYESFALMRKAYLDAMTGKPDITKYYNQDEWDDGTLHISELGKCPRQQMLRLSGAEKKYETPEKQANDALMYYTGNMVHALTVAAADWAGIMVAFEESLASLRDGWSGHFDLIYSEVDEETGDPQALVCWDGKTTRPNAFRYWYTWPKPEHVWQMLGYLHHLKGITYGEIEYIGSGGSNTPRTYTIGRKREHLGDVLERMDLLDAYRDMLPDLPDPLPPRLEPTYRKAANLPTWNLSKVLFKNSWQCEWCPYHWASKPDWQAHEDSPCKPQMITQEVAKMSKGHLSADEVWQEMVADWLHSQVQSYTDPNAQVEVEEHLPF